MHLALYNEAVVFDQATKLVLPPIMLVLPMQMACISHASWCLQAVANPATCSGNITVSLAELSLLAGWQAWGGRILCTPLPGQLMLVLA